MKTNEFYTLHYLSHFSMHTAVNPLHNPARRFVPLAILWLILAPLAACGGGGSGGGGGGSAADIQPPVASDGAVTTLEDSTVNATLNASDPSGLTLTFRKVSNPGKGAVVVNANGSFTYTPNPNANGSDSFTFVANNGGSDSNVATVTITITPASDPPVAVNDTYTVAGSGQSLIVSAPNCSDPDSNERGVLCNDTDPDVPTTLTVAAADTGGPWALAHGSLTLNANGSFTYLHNGDTSTSDSFTYRANDGVSNSVAATVTLSINQPPEANNACVSTPVNTPVSGALSATDPEGQSVTYALGAQGGKGTVNIDVNGNYSYTPNSSSFRGMDKFTYEVTDSLNQSSTGTVTVLIDSVTPGRVRIMPLGDSITSGYPGDDSTEPFWVSYRRKLYNDLTALNPTMFGVDFVGSVTDTGASANPPLADRDHEGQDGWCDDNNPTCTVSGGQNIASSVIGFLNSNPADIILLHIGTNHFNTSSAGVNTILNNISTWAQSNHPVTVFVARIIPSVNGNLNVNTFNNNVEAIATDRTDVKVYSVDQQGVLQLPGQPNNANPGLMGDNLHPTQTGYDMLADKWKLDMLGAGVLPTCP